MLISVRKFSYLLVYPIIYFMVPIINIQISVTTLKKFCLQFFVVPLFSNAFGP